MIHKSRYLAAMNLYSSPPQILDNIFILSKSYLFDPVFREMLILSRAPSQRPPVALRYALWTVASSITDRYLDLKDHFYQRARKYLELDYLKGHGEHIMSVGHAQAHILLASYEFKMMYFPRAWMNTGAGVRLCQM